MPVTANARFRNLGVASLPRTTPVPEKRRNFRRDSRAKTERNVPEAAPPISPGVTYEFNEAEAIRRAQAGDPEVFEYLYHSHSRRVYALCLRMVKDAAEAEDLTQETFLLLFRKIHTFRGESAFSTWLHSLPVNLVLMRQTTTLSGATVWPWRGRAITSPSCDSAASARRTGALPTP